MNPVIRFFQDILGHFVEKTTQTKKIILVVALTGVIYYFWGVTGVLNAIAIILWTIALFMFFILFYSVIKDRNKRK